jgi:polypeptide N-acetylgalactosaminyltransferase
MMRITRRKLILAIFCFGVVLGYFWIFAVDTERNLNRIFEEKASAVERKCRDWNEYEFIKTEGRRIGPGEQGKGVKLVDPSEITLNEKLYNQTGFSVVVSNKISVNRSIPDFRVEECRNQKNLAALPNVSVIIIFHNEVKSVLLRTVHSVINRTPPELLHEIILVNDNSNSSELYEPLQSYVDANFHGKVKIKNLSERKGLIVTRLEGGRIATGEVLVFFDSHMEVGYNWLPPLLDPIAVNRRLATVPIIDDFDSESFEAYQNNPYGSRGAIDWWLVYHMIPRNITDDIDLAKPFPIPIMLGCAFAIDRKFFLEELGGYDEGFQIWNAENYELSFKLWLCADGLFEVPCSHVTHTFRRINPSRQGKDDFVARNFKRLAEVWMDEYKDVVYSFDPSRYAKVDAGDLTKPKQVHNRLNCKPFKYFLEEIAPDLLQRFPATVKQPVFASGQIKSLAQPNICIDTFYRDEFTPIGLFYCNELDDVGKPSQAQFFRLNFLKSITWGHLEHCLDSFDTSLPQCNYADYGNQYWRLDYKRHLLINNADDGEFCLAGNFHNQTLSMKLCDENDENQLWSFTYENQTALDDWRNIYGYAKFMTGRDKVNYDKLLPLEYEIC